MRNEKQEAQWQAAREKIAAKAYKWANGFDSLDKSSIPWKLIVDKDSFYNFAETILALPEIEVRDKDQALPFCPSRRLHRATYRASQEVMLKVGFVSVLPK